MFLFVCSRSAHCLSGVCTRNFYQLLLQWFTDFIFFWIIDNTLRPWPLPETPFHRPYMIPLKVLRINGFFPSSLLLSTIGSYSFNFITLQLFCLLTCWPIYSPTSRMYILKNLFLRFWIQILSELFAAVSTGLRRFPGSLVGAQICLMEELREDLHLRLGQCQILSVTRSKYPGCWLLAKGSGGCAPYLPEGTLRGWEKETSSISHRALHQSCIPHILSWWTVPAGTAEEHINNSTARAWPLRILSYSYTRLLFFWNKSHSESQLDLLHSNFWWTCTVFISGSILKLESNLASGINTTWASLCGLDNLKS